MFVKQRVNLKPKTLKVRQAKEDADCLFFKTAIEEASKHISGMIIIGENVDLSVF